MAFVPRSKARTDEAPVGGDISVKYTAAMPIDVAARVIAESPLSRDYNVLALSAPDIAASRRPANS